MAQTSVGVLAVQQDLMSLRPARLPADQLPDGTAKLTEVLGGRYLFHYCNSSDVDAILRSGLWPGSWCSITSLSSYTADIWLGTPTRKDYVLIIDPSRVSEYRGPGVSLGFPSEPLRIGGAVEFFLPNGAPPQSIVSHGRLEEF